MESDRRYKKVAIVHDWLVGGGAERVVFELHRMFPEAPIYTSYCSDEWRQKLDGKVVTGYLQHWPFSKLRKFVGVLRIWWFTHLNFEGYDLVISSSGNGEAKGIKVPKGTTHICYCHSPTHYYWRHYDQYLSQPGFGAFDPLARFGLRLLVGPLRKWDLKASRRPDYYIANSTHIQSDIKKYYERDSTVIYPPVNVSRFQAAGSSERHGFITIGRQVPFKKTDIIMQACIQLGLPLTVIGKGPDHAKLAKLAEGHDNITLIANASDSEVARAMSSAEAFLFAGFEDFGITPIEAMAAGTPVIAYKAGGALDYVQPGVTGEFFTEQTFASIAQALKSFNSAAYDPLKVSQSVQKYSDEVFRNNMSAYIASTAVTTKLPGKMDAAG